MHKKWGVKSLVAKGIDRGWVFGYMLGGFAFFALVEKLMNKWSYGFCAIFVGKCHKCIENEVWKVRLQKEFILVGFWLSQVRWIGFFFSFVPKLVNKWSYGFCAILVGNCHKCIQIEVWKAWLLKKLILVGFWLSQVRWIRFVCLGSKIGEQVKLWFLCNLCGELSQMHKKWGVKSLVAKGIDLCWVLAYPSSVDWLFFALVEKLVNKWIYGFCAIFVGNCHKCIKNEVWKVWLQKELILVWFLLSQVRWIGFFCLGSKIGE